MTPRSTAAAVIYGVAIVALVAAAFLAVTGARRPEQQRRQAFARCRAIMS
jgi:hypothetical protein